MVPSQWKKGEHDRSHAGEGHGHEYDPTYGYRGSDSNGSKHAKQLADAFWA